MQPLKYSGSENYSTKMIAKPHEILVWAAEQDPDDERVQKIRCYLSNVNSLDHLTRTALKEGLAGSLYKCLLKTGLLDTLCPEERQKLYHNYYLTIRRNLKFMHALKEILGQLKQNDIQVVLMQGISLIQEEYPDIGLRPMSDMDLWVLPCNRSNLIECLMDLGYKGNSIYPNTFVRGEIMLDIHTHVLWADRIQSRSMLLHKSQEEIFNNTRPIQIGQTAALRLNPQDQFLYLSMHALKHNLERLIWLVDIKSLVAKWTPADWKALIVRAEELGLQAQFFYMFFVLRKIFDMEFPSEIQSNLAGWQPNLLEQWALSRRIKGRSIPAWSRLALLAAGKGLRRKAAFVIETLFPRPEILRQVFPDASDSCDRKLYWKRFLQILSSFKLN